jgi:ParB-like chromosome segregation protein Spo0J
MTKTTFADRLAAVGLVESEVLGGIIPEHLHPIGQVEPNEWNPKECNEARLLALAESLKRHGWLAHDLPLLWQDRRGHFTIINGEHRWKVLVAAGFAQFPGIVTTAVKSREDGMALTMALEEAKARRDGKQYLANLVELAKAKRDEELRSIFRVDAEAIRERARQKAEEVQIAARERLAAGPPRIITLLLPGPAFARFQEATAKARTALQRAGIATKAVEELSSGEVADLALLWREWRLGKR